MARLYANENFPLDVVGHLRALGHDVLTTHDTGKSNLRIADEAVLRIASDSDRAVITLKRKDFIRLHRDVPTHRGIIVCTENRDYAAFARRIDDGITQAGELSNLLIRVVRGPVS